MRKTNGTLTAEKDFAPICCARKSGACPFLLCLDPIFDVLAPLNTPSNTDSIEHRGKYEFGHEVSDGNCPYPLCNALLFTRKFTRVHGLQLVVACLTKQTGAIRRRCLPLYPMNLGLMAGIEALN